MTESKRPLKVFLCHASADKTVVSELYKRLIKDFVNAWFDKESLLPGQNWELEIRKVVREADVVVVCLSKQFNQAGFRQKEVRLALDTAMEKPEGEIFIIPARLEECENLESLRHLHWVDLFEEDGYEKLKLSLGLRAEQVGAMFLGKFMSKPLTIIPGELGTQQEKVVFSAADQNGIGIALVKGRKYSNAIQYFEQALKLSRDASDKRSETTILSNLGSTYEKIGDLVQAINYYEQATQLAARLGK